MDDDGDAPCEALHTREATRMIGVSQPWAAGWLAMRPTDACARVRSAEFVWGLQRRFGLHVSAAQTDLLQLAVHAG
eukprot:2019015-Prymnesium_polylepis.1